MNDNTTTQIPTEDITNGSLDGSIIWVCDYRRADLAKKPQRAVRPTQVVVVSNSELPANKTVYYSHSHLRALNKRGVAKKTVIPVFDNTGFRSRTGTPLKAFWTSEACAAQYLEDLGVVSAALEEKKANVLGQIQGDIDRIDMIAESVRKDYMVEECKVKEPPVIKGHTVSSDPKEVAATSEFQELQRQAKEFVNSIK